MTGNFSGPSRLHALPLGHVETCRARDQEGWELEAGACWALIWGQKNPDTFPPPRPQSLTKDSRKAAVRRRGKGHLPGEVGALLSFSLPQFLSWEERGGGACLLPSCPG